MSEKRGPYKYEYDTEVASFIIESPIKIALSAVAASQGVSSSWLVNNALRNILGFRMLQLQEGKKP